jgi:hypothetical protein
MRPKWPDLAMQREGPGAESLSMSSSDQRELGTMDRLIAAFAAEVPPETPVAVPTVEAAIPAPRQPEATQLEEIANTDPVDLPSLYRELRLLESGLPPVG